MPQRLSRRCTRRYLRGGQESRADRSRAAIPTGVNLTHAAWMHAEREENAMITEDFKLVATGLSVYQDENPVEGPVAWLDTPAAVIAFVSSGRAAESIVVARGGTTTFLTPALTAGVKGVVPLQGHPESHLGILSREYGIPCVMGVSFTEGVRSSRGEVIPAEGATVRIDVSEQQGRVFIEPS